ncbi:MAG: CocE/NonD family hydrolase [Gemmatimonadales bacterium]|nr:CocE/NonD family hydrolase [Gemmatimonadales bacterium]
MPLHCARGLRCALLAALLVTPTLSAQQFDFAAGRPGSDSALATGIRELADRVLSTSRDTAVETQLENRFHLEIASGRYREASTTLRALRQLRQVTAPARAASTIPYEVYARALANPPPGHASLDEAVKRSYHSIVDSLDDRIAAHQVLWVFGAPLRRLERLWQSALDSTRAKRSITRAEAVDLIRRFVAVQAYQRVQPLVPRLQAEDDARRYLIQRDIAVRTPDGATICVLVVRPRASPGPLPALLNFTIYADSGSNMRESRRSASHGYAGVGALTRGKGCSPDHPVAIEHDGADASAVIDWISRQPWSDGRVGTYGGSYEGFTQWAAAKHLPPALKAMMPSVTFAPGIDFPMDGNVFMNYAYPWPFYTTNGKGLDTATYFDSARWQRLNHEWYVSGRAYRDLDLIDGAANPIFDQWLRHPSYDRYWQRAIPYQEEFARITIPVLTTTGYYDSGQLGALYYFRQHHAYAPGAEHYLVIGPYDHVGGQRGTITPLGGTRDTLRGYPLDPTAQLDIGELRYQWFDHVFKRAPKPALLGDKVNFQVMGANVWRHAPSIAAMADARERLYLSADRSGAGYLLTASRPVRDAVIAHTVDLADRTDAARMAAGGEIIDQALDDWTIVARSPRIGNAIEFVGEVLSRPTEVSGLFSARLSFITNKADFDFSLTLFERLATGEYFQLSYHWARASYAEDRTRRRLLAPGKRQHLKVVSGRLTSRQLRRGSRLVVVLGVIKQSGQQINYGTGKDVSDETIADAAGPLQIRWLNDSYVDLPVRR